MARRIHLRTDLSVDELERRYRAAKEPHERSWWQILWLLARGQLAKDIAASTGYSRYWIGQIAKRYNAEGPAGMRNRQYTHSHRSAPLLAPELLAELARAVRGPAPAGDDHWLGRTVADWMSTEVDPLWWTPIDLGEKPLRRCSHVEAYGPLPAGVSC